MTAARTVDLSVELRAAEWPKIEVVRRSIHETLGDYLVDEGCQTIAMIARELLENAVKYGDQSTVRLYVWEPNARSLCVRVENGIKPADGRVEQLMSALAWMKQFATPAEAFQARLLDARNPGESGLGLVRIAFEGNCSIGAEVVDSVLRITADVPVDDAWVRLTAPTDLGQASVAMENLATGDLRIEAQRDAATGSAPIVLKWRGNSVDSNPAQTVLPYCRQVYDRAAEDKVDIEMRFEELAYFNSATISVLIQLIQEARTRNLGLLLTYDASVKWQRLNFEALSVFTKGSERLTVKSI